MLYLFFQNTITNRPAFPEICMLYRNMVVEKTADNFQVSASYLILSKTARKADVSSLTGDISGLLCLQNKIWVNHVYSVLV